MPTICFGWIGGAAVGLWLVARYSMTPAVAGHAPAAWPAESKIPRAADGPTLLMFLHPQCPCSRASVGELAKIMRACEGRVAARVLVVKPRGTPEGWERTDLWDSAAAIPRTVVMTDPDGAEAILFGAVSSGEVRVFAEDGRLQFQGGITIARGHHGDNPGADSVISWVTQGRHATHQAPVFGCELFSRNNCDPSPANDEEPSCKH